MNEFDFMTDHYTMPKSVVQGKKRKKRLGSISKNKKILVFNHHFATVPSSLYKEFKEKVIMKGTLTDWIIKALNKEFDYEMYDESDFGYIELKLREAFYQDKSEWLREKMRAEVGMYSTAYSSLVNFYISRKTEQGRELYLCEDESLMRRYHERFVYWSDEIEQRLTFSDGQTAREYVRSELSDKVNYTIVKKRIEY